MGAKSSTPNTLNVQSRLLNQIQPGTSLDEQRKTAVDFKETGNDYSLLPLCFGKAYNEPLGINVDAVKRFEYMLYIGAEASRLVYCDVGILKMSLVKAFGLSPDILNQVITHYDAKFKSKKTNILTRKNQDFAPESYRLEACANPEDFTNGGKAPLARYISSPTDTTVVVINPSALKKNDNSIITSTDCIVTFKGSSSLRNWEKNLRAVFSGDLAESIKTVISGAPAGIKIAKSFITPIVEIFNDILKAIQEVCPGCTRLFVFGHSKGGAEAELGGSMLSLCMGKSLPSVTQVHIISYGAPRVIDPQTSTVYNDTFFTKNNGNFTLTRVESVGTIVGDNVTDMPPKIMVHPGWGNKSNTLDEVRKNYAGLPVTDNKRNPATWPFTEDIKLWDRDKFGRTPALYAAVEKIVGEPAEEPVATGGERATYVRVRGSYWSPNPHMEYMGMFFLGSQRIPGMGNPAKTSGDRKEVDGSNVNKTFTANIFEECTKYVYVPWNSLGSSLDVFTDIGDTGVAVGNQLEQNASYLKNQVLGKGRRKTYRSKKASRKRKHIK